MSDYGLVVIGGGEAGISAALRAAQLGAKVCLINRESELGGGDIVIGQCGYNDLVRSYLDGNVTGFFKLIFDGPTRRLIGAHVAGQDASEIIHFAALAVKMGARAEDLKDMVYNHPTVSEGFGKAAADALKKFEQRTPA